MKFQLLFSFFALVPTSFQLILMPIKGDVTKKVRIFHTRVTDCTICSEGNTLFAVREPLACPSDIVNDFDDFWYDLRFFERTMPTGIFVVAKDGYVNIFQSSVTKLAGLILRHGGNDIFDLEVIENEFSTKEMRPGDIIAVGRRKAIYETASSIQHFLSSANGLEMKDLENTLWVGEAVDKGCFASFRVQIVDP